MLAPSRSEAQQSNCESHPPVLRATSRGVGPAANGSSTLRFRLVALTVLYILLVAGIYREYVTDTWGYLGFSSRSVPTVTLATTILLAALPSLVLPLRRRSVATSSVWVLYYIIVAPAGYIVPVSAPDGARDPITVVAALSCGIAIVAATTRLVGSSQSQIRVLPTLRLESFELGLLLSAVALVAVTGLSFGFNFRPWVLFDGIAVREIRFEGRELEGGFHGLGGYSRNSLGKVVAPALILLGLARIGLPRGRLVLLAGSGASIFAFSAQANVSLILGLGLVAAMYHAMSPERARSGWSTGESVATAFLALTALSFVAASIGWRAPVDDLVRRGVMTPAMLSVRYFDFFSDQPLAWFEDTPMGSVLPQAYEEPIARVIGRAYAMPDGTHANANFLADGYAQAGLAGVLTTSLAVGVVLGFVDLIGRSKDQRFVAGVMALPLWSLADSGLTNAFLSHGLVLAIVVVAVSPVRRVREAQMLT